MRGMSVTYLSMGQGSSSIKIQSKTNRYRTSIHTVIVPWAVVRTVHASLSLIRCTLYNARRITGYFYVAIGSAVVPSPFPYVSVIPVQSFRPESYATQSSRPVVELRLGSIMALRPLSDKSGRMYRNWANVYSRLRARSPRQNLNELETSLHISARVLFDQQQSVILKNLSDIKFGKPQCECDWAMSHIPTCNRSASYFDVYRIHFYIVPATREII